MRLALFQPEIPQNVGTLLRFGACMGVEIAIIEPCGFIFTDKKLKRAGMDYITLANMKRFDSWDNFKVHHSHTRIIAVTPEANTSFTQFSFSADDVLLMGQESCGFPSFVLDECATIISIPMISGRRSLNVAIAAAIVTTEALRQTHQLPGEIHGS